MYIHIYLNCVPKIVGDIDFKTFISLKVVQKMSNLLDTNVSYVIYLTCNKNMEVSKIFLLKLILHSSHRK